MIGDLLLVLCVLGQAPQAPPDVALALQASTPEPFVGEVVTLRLLITTPKDPAAPSTGKPITRQASAGEAPRLTIPWLSADWGWRLSLEEWLCAHVMPHDGLAVQVNDVVPLIWIPRTEQGPDRVVHELQWQLVARPRPYPHGDVLHVRPVRWHWAGKEVQSNELKIVMRPVPPTSRRASGIDLGVGHYEITARLAATTASPREGALLHLQVTGTGALEQIERPRLAEVSAWLAPGGFRVEFVDDSWSDAATRTWSYRLYPLRTGDAAVPAIPFTFFDPRVEREVQCWTNSLPLRFEQEQSSSGMSPTPPVPGAVPTMPWATPEDAPYTAIAARVPEWLVLGALALPPLVWLTLATFRVLQDWKRRQAGLSPPALKAVRGLEIMNRDSASLEAIAGLFAQFLQERYSLAAVEPTPADLASCLENWRVEPELRRAADEWWRDCLAQRFGAAHNESRALAARARSLIVKLDAVRDATSVHSDVDLA